MFKLKNNILREYFILYISSKIKCRHFRVSIYKKRSALLSRETAMCNCVKFLIKVSGLFFFGMCNDDAATTSSTTLVEMYYYITNTYVIFFYLENKKNIDLIMYSSLTYYIICRIF